MKNLYANVKSSANRVFRNAFLLVASLFFISSSTFGQKGQPAASLEQIRNGSASKPVDPAQWQNGNAGNQTAHYVEGHSIGYRALLTNLPLNTPITLILGYDVRHSSKNAIDFLTNYDRLQPHGQFLTGGSHPAQELVDPTIGTSYSGAPTDTYVIPRPEINNAFDIPGLVWDAISDPKKSMAIWGGDITNIVYSGVGANLANSQSEQQISVTFTVTNPNAVLAWGGHIANRKDWGSIGGVPLSAGGISGSPYHMRLINWNLNNLGNQDRSLSAAAVIAPPDCDVTGFDDVCSGTVVTYTGPTGADSYAWTLESNTSSAFFTGNNSTSAITINGPTNTVTVNSGPNNGGYTIKLVTTLNGIPSDADCDIPVTVYKVETPRFTVQEAALCGSATAGITICAPQVGVTYKVTQDAGGAAEQSTTYVSGTLSFGNLVPGKNVYVVASVAVDGNATCSATASCSDASCTPPSNRQAAPAPNPTIGKAEAKDLIAYPVPFSDNVTVEFKAKKAENYVINLYDLQGHLVRELKAGNARAGEVIKVEVSGAGMSESMYLVRKVSKSGISTVKLLKKD